MEEFHGVPHPTPSSKFGDGPLPPSKICIAIGSQTERDSISVPANKVYLILEEFHGVSHPTLYPKLGDVPMLNVYCDRLVNVER